MSYYVHAKKYVIRPSKKEEVLAYINEHLRGSKWQTATARVIQNKAMVWRRWMYYFDFTFLEDVLMEEDCVEITEDLGL